MAPTPVIMPMVSLWVAGCKHKVSEPPMPHLKTRVCTCTPINASYRLSRLLLSRFCVCPSHSTHTHTHTHTHIFFTRTRLAGEVWGEAFKVCSTLPRVFRYIDQDFLLPTEHFTSRPQHIGHSGINRRAELHTRTNNHQQQTVHNTVTGHPKQALARNEQLITTFGSACPCQHSVHGQFFTAC